MLLQYWHNHYIVFDLCKKFGKPAGIQKRSANGINYHSITVSRRQPFCRSLVGLPFPGEGMLCEERVRKLSTRCDGAWSVMVLNVVFRVSHHVGSKQEDTNVMYEDWRCLWHLQRESWCGIFWGSKKHNEKVLLQIICFRPSIVK